MTEGIADANDDATSRHATLYKTWAEGGAGLLITGNVMVDRRFLERPGNVVVDAKTSLDALEAWAQAGTVNDTHLWMQISHPGRQCSRTTNPHPVAPSAVQLKLAGLFAKPRALADEEIEGIITAWVNTANVAKNVGFTGVQIHSAHGYLNSQFLSPITNQRTDKWGGSLENRARFLLTIVERTRETVGPNFPVCVKLNSSDFQKGGFSDDDAATVAGWLEQRGIDLLEVSGGTYENVAFLDTEARPSAREAYFLEYANIIRAAAPNVPLMITGGFRTPEFMETTLAGGDVDVIGLGRPFCVAPNFPNALRAGSLHKLPTPEFDIQIGSGFWGHRSTSATLRGLNSQAGTAWFYEQIYRLADGEAPQTHPGSAMGVLSRHFQREFKMAKRRTHPI